MTRHLPGMPSQAASLAAQDGDGPSDGLAGLASLAGIATEWIDNDGVIHRPSAATLRAVLAALGQQCASQRQITDAIAGLLHDRQAAALPAMLTAWCGKEIKLPLYDPARPRVHIEFDSGVRQDIQPRAGADGAMYLPGIGQPGYHRIEWAGQSCTLAVAPARAYTVEDAANGARLWGLSAQTYGLHGADGGTGASAGTFREAGVLARNAAKAGADALMLSPSHALFAHDADHFSPYSPSSRFHYNVLLGDPACLFSRERLAALRAANPYTDAAPQAPGDLIDWRRASQAHHARMRALHESFLAVECAQAGNALAADFHGWVKAGGEALQQHALFECLHGEAFAADPFQWHWRSWDTALQSPHSGQCRSFASAHAQDINYHLFLQWMALRSGAWAQAQALEAGMRIGLIGDLAIGVNDGGSHAWSRPADLLRGLSIGAPPDALAPRGQDWGLTTFCPFALRNSGFASLLETLRASLAVAGGLRIDHVMGLRRLWLIPQGGGSADGAYVRYPFEDILRLVVLESWRSKKIIIGEDLGTVPAGLRETLDSAGIAGMRVLVFEKDGADFRPPGHYRESAIAMTTTHDTPTLRGWHRGADIDLRERLDQLPPGVSAERAHRERDGDRLAARRAFSQAGIGPASGSHMTRSEKESHFAADAIAYLAHTPSRLAIVPLEDVTGAAEQPNLPGTTTGHPNWRRKYALPVCDMLVQEPAARHVAILSRARPRDRTGSDAG